MKQKRLFSLLLAAGLCVSLAACGGTDDTADDPVTEPDQEPTGYTAEELGQDDFTPAALAEVSGTWVDGYGAVLQINADAESYLYRTDEGRVGQGWVRDADGEAWLNFNRYQHLFELSDDGNTIYIHPLDSEMEDAPPDADTETLFYETFTRDDAKEMADNGVFEASGKTAQQMKEMIDAMDDETFIRFFRPYMRAILSMQMQQETVKAYSGMTSQEVISAISAKGISSSQYADVYDNYVASSASGSTYNNNLKKLGYVDKDSPSAINIYASSFENKDQISACIDDYNADAAENDQISYTDYVGLLMSSITTIINAISYVLIGFVAISLVVSSIMIGIITYISVLERTKEIGILRSIGASKQDISRVFNAETLIEGFTAGVMGILCTLILLIPINLIVHHLTGLPTLSAILPVLGAILLILISMALTFIAGLIPSGMAAKKDPVVALRTE